MIWVIRSIRADPEVERVEEEVWGPHPLTHTFFRSSQNFTVGKGWGGVGGRGGGGGGGGAGAYLNPPMHDHCKF